MIFINNTVSAFRLGLLCAWRSPTHGLIRPWKLSVTSPTFELVLDMLEYEGIMSNVSVARAETTIMPVVEVQGGTDCPSEELLQLHCESCQVYL